MRYVMVACDVMHREISYCVSRSKAVVDVRFLKKGLHDVGQSGMSSSIQEEIDRIPSGEYEAVLIGYGLCNMGTRGLFREDMPMIIPRAHDCITMLLGSKERYQESFDREPGTFYRSTGWIERDSPRIGEDGKPISVMTQLGFNQTYEELLTKFSEDNARYIMETMKEWEGTRNYTRLAYIDMGIGEFPALARLAREEALEKGWRYEALQGDTGLLQSLVDGDWDDERFLVVPPGKTIAPTYLDNIVSVTEREPNSP
jgi:hypothetical protein|tara:strand:+ start:452 stop:1222 length:771 start_codon:yes stop_codon:yes gene_type:complete